MPTVLTLSDDLSSIDNFVKTRIEDVNLGILVKTAIYLDEEVYQQSLGAIPKSLQNMNFDNLNGLDKSAILFKVLGESLALSMFQNISEADLMRIRVRSRELRNILKNAVESNEPTLVDIISQPLHEAAAPVSEWIA